MSSQYNGIAGDVSAPSALAISSSTDATPIKVVTSTSHGLMTGDSVQVYDHATNVNANVITSITKVDATSFTLDGTTATGAGAGGATGHVQPYSYNAESYQIPSDGDNIDAASVNVAFEALGDRSAKIAVTNPILPLTISGTGRGPARFRDFRKFANVDFAYSSLASRSFSATTWSALQSGGNDYVLGTIDRLCPGDDILLKFTGTAAGTSVGGFPSLAFGYKQYGPGATPPAATALSGTGGVIVAPLGVVYSGGTIGTQVTLLDEVNWSSSVLGGSMAIVLMAYSSAGNGTAALYGSWRLEAYVLR